MDPLSDVLSLLKPRSYLSAGFDAGGRWCLQFGQFDGIKIIAVVSGRCWLAVDGLADVFEVMEGDCFLLPHGHSFRLASDMSLPPVDAKTVFPPVRRGGVAVHNGGGEFFMTGSHFTLTGHHAGILLSVLPPVVRIRDEAGRSALRWSLERMGHELREQLPGNTLVAENLAHMMLVEMLRSYLSDGFAGREGWLFALGDKQIGNAISHIHEDPAARWTVGSLAGRVGMSRTAFAVRFKSIVGVSPMNYLKRWRMLIAADRLAHSDKSVSAIASSIGYESESAFGLAFKQTMGCSPREYSRARRAL